MAMAKGFRESWDGRKAFETSYLHWTRGEPETQIQLAFRSHWTLFQEILAAMEPEGKRCVELGCGRGTMSMYFADAGWDCTLVDLSDTVLDRAREAFAEHDLKARFLEGDAMATGLPDGAFDVCVSIGLLEHLPDLEGALAEQVRLLAPGGVLLAYVVPERDNGAQRGWEWLNDMLAAYHELATGRAIEPGEKPDVYRSDDGIARYLELLKDMPLERVQASGVYPLPMLSPSVSFPFTLNPPAVERRLTAHFKALLDERARQTGRNPWLCDEDWGQAFLVWGRKV